MTDEPVRRRFPTWLLITVGVVVGGLLGLGAAALLGGDDDDDADALDLAPVESMYPDDQADNAEAFLQKLDADLLVSGHIACDNGFATPNDRQVILDSAESPAGYILFPADRPLTHAELVGCIRTF